VALLLDGGISGQLLVREAEGADVAADAERTAGAGGKSAIA